MYKLKLCFLNAIFSQYFQNYFNNAEPNSVPIKRAVTNTNSGLL